MQYIKGLNAYQNNRRTAVTLGKFDGLHQGHEKLVHSIIRIGKKEELDTVVCSFNMVPFLERLGKDPKILMTKEEQSFRLQGRVDYLIDIPFTKTFSRITAEDFIRDILVELLHAAVVVVGTDFNFGYQKKGNAEVLKEYATIFGYRVVVVEKERYKDRIVSSTYIKEALTDGDLDLANRLLGYPYSIMGVVEHGRKLGRRLGFPTLNLAPERHKLLPPRGVYMARVSIDGNLYDGICNVGIKPTVTEKQRMLVESYLFDYQGDAYDKKVVVELLKFCRPEERFESLEELKAAIDKDIERGREFFQVDESI